MPNAKPQPFLTDVAPLPWFSDMLLPALVPSAGIPRALLRDFTQAMQQQGMAVQPQRLRYDRVYARSCLANAHSQGDARLRGLAMRLFDCIEDPGAR